MLIDDFCFPALLRQATSPDARRKMATYHVPPYNQATPFENNKVVRPGSELDTAIEKLRRVVGPQE